jgi:hypothetical protein
LTETSVVFGRRTAAHQLAEPFMAGMMRPTNKDDLRQLKAILEER